MWIVKSGSNESNHWFHACLFDKKTANSTHSFPFAHILFAAASLIQQRFVQIPHVVLLPIVHRVRHLPHLQDIVVRHRRQRPLPLRLTSPRLSHVRIPRQIVHLRRVSPVNEQQLRRPVLRLLRRLLLADLPSTPLLAPTFSRSHTIMRRSSPAVASTLPRIGAHSPAKTAPVCPSSTWYGNARFRSSHSATVVSELAVTNSCGTRGLNRTTLHSFPCTRVLPLIVETGETARRARLAGDRRDRGSRRLRPQRAADSPRGAS